MVLGVEPKVEAQWSGLARNIKSGAYLAADGEAVIGEALARNLGVKLGDDLIILGTAKNGGIAAHAATIVGIFRSGSTELDRTLVQIPVGDFREAWSMGVEEAHAVVGVSRALLDSAARTSTKLDIKACCSEVCEVTGRQVTGRHEMTKSSKS